MSSGRDGETLYRLVDLCGQYHIVTESICFFQFVPKAVSELGNTVAETLCFLSMFSCLPTSENVVAETKFASEEFTSKFRNIFVP